MSNDTKVAARHQKAITEVIEGFDLNGQSDYVRMRAEVQEATGLVLNNTAVWACINRVSGSTKRVSAYDMGWLKK